MKIWNNLLFCRCIEKESVGSGKPRGYSLETLIGKNSNTSLNYESYTPCNCNAMMGRRDFQESGNLRELVCEWLTWTLRYRGWIIDASVTEAAVQGCILQFGNRMVPEWANCGRSAWMWSHFISSLTIHFCLVNTSHFFLSFLLHIFFIVLCSSPSSVRHPPTDCFPFFFC